MPTKSAKLNTSLTAEHSRLTMMMKILVAALIVGSSFGFAPVPLGRHRSVSTAILSSTSSNPIQETTVEDAFASYSISNPLQQLAYRDTVVGDGDTIERGKVVTVAYEGRLMSNGYKFDFGTGYAFRFGEGNVIPGWEVGLVVCTKTVVAAAVDIVSDLFFIITLYFGFFFISNNTNSLSVLTQLRINMTGHESWWQANSSDSSQFGIRRSGCQG